MQPVHQGAPSARGRSLSRVFLRFLQLSTVAGLLALLTGAVVPAPSSDDISDRVGATAGKFEVSSTGAATYSIPIYTTPGVAGFAPKLSLEYNSQGGDGPLGKGWSIAGTSMISRCRASRETADFAGDNQASGAGAGPLRMNSSDKLCLDGERLVEASTPASAGSCAALNGATVTEYRTEIDSNQRVCSYRWAATDSNGTPIDIGLRFFTVERQDGTVSWYGDRRETAGDIDETGTVDPLRTDSVSVYTRYVYNYTTKTYEYYVPHAIMSWAQTRRMDASGNYIDYQYTKVGEEMYLDRVNYTGKKNLPGQSTGDLTPNNSIVFAYTDKPAFAVSRYRLGPLLMMQSRALRSVTVTDAGREARHYALTYNDTDYNATTNNGVGFNLTSVQECADSTKAICYPATQFAWSYRHNTFTTPDVLNAPSWGRRDDFDGYKLGDVDGDGLQDIVRLKDANCDNEEVSVAFSTIGADGKVQMVEPPQNRFCTPREIVGTISEEGNAWFLFDYDGDGRDDLFTAGDTADGGYVLYKSQGRPNSTSTRVFVETNAIYGLLPQPNSSEDLAQLADMNGDGLLDVFYKRNGAFKARLMERLAGTDAYGWGAERSVIANAMCPASTGGDTWTCTLVTPKVVKTNGGVHMYDFNGDSRSELLFKNKQHCSGCNDTEALEAYGVTEITPTTITLGYVTSWDTTKYDFDNDLDLYITRDHRFGDFNGDGITDVVYRKNVYVDRYGETGGDWYYYSASGETQLAANEPVWGLTTAMQIVDVNGDGRDDIVTANQWSAYVRYGQGSGNFAPIQGIAADAPPTACGSTDCANDYTFIYSDFDGDAGIDLLKIKWKDSDVDMSMYRGTPSKRYVPRDAIVTITDGLGARTDVTYLPMMLNGVHQRDIASTCATNYAACTRNALKVGRGSPAQDVQAPMYVVNRVTTDSPTVDAAARRTVHYRYTGAKIQAGGRGFLGFREVTAIDTAYAGKYVATTTEFRQDFPFIGRPLKQTTIVANGAYDPGACGTPATLYTSACFVSVKDANAAGNKWAPIAGTKVSETVYDWTSPNFVASTQLTTPSQLPIRVELHQTDSLAFDLANGAQTSETLTKFTYDAFSNALTTEIDTLTGTADPTPLVKTTTSTYLNDTGRWILGRMLTSSVAHTRAGTTITRRTAFTYDVNTGLLTSERIEPNGDPSRDLRTEYVLDDFGNRTAAFTCSQNISAADCQNKDKVVNVWESTNTIHRYTRRTYDARGRFMELEYEPFRKVSTAWGTGERQEVVVANNEYIDKFGNMTHWVGVNGLHHASSFGAMGRPYWSWTQTVPDATAGDDAGGIDSFTTYRTCAGAGCPTGAAFRVRVAADDTSTVSDEMPKQWTYFDKLGRQVLQVKQTHNVGVANMDAVAVCTWYDSAGRVAGVSTPFFLPGTTAGDPTFTVQPCVQSARDVTYTYYDVLGRPTRVLAPDASQTTMAYTGLATTTTNALNQVKVETKNALGELLSSTDNAGLTTTYAYDSTGNLTKVMRDAGRGVITTQMWYDILGRRTKLVDPDAGTRTYSFNAAGEQLTESDGVMWSAKRYDFKGRVIWEGVKNLADTGYEATVTRDYDLGVSGGLARTVGQLTAVANTGHYLAWKPDTTLKVNYAVGYSFDQLGRRIGTSTSIDGVPYAEVTQYDALGRPWKQQDATGRWAKTDFTARGTMLRVCESTELDTDPNCLAASTATYYDRVQVNERGDVAVERRGGTALMTGKRTYDPLTGALLTICNGYSADVDPCKIVNDTYHWDDIGNLVDRENISFREHFQYDGMNRLQSAYYSKWNGAEIANAASVALTYDALGNICSKQDGGGQVGAYWYTGPSGCGLNGLPGSGSTAANSPHAVRTVAFYGGVKGLNFSYDTHGNQTGSQDRFANAVDRQIKYTLWDQAHEITRKTRQSRFWYGDGGVRYKREDLSVGLPGTVTRTLQVGNVEIVSGPAGAYKRRYIAGVMYQQISLNAQNVEVAVNYYLHHDHLGNIVAVTNPTGVVQERLGYSALGDRIALDTRGAPATANLTRRGFTGHEQFEALNVVHMNGRIYDPTIGRFLQVDPVVQDPSNGQNYNRYTYVWNNPLAYTDPTGMISVKNLIKNIVGIYLGAYIGNRGGFGMTPGSTTARAFGAFVGGYVASGNLKTALAGAFSVAVLTQQDQAPTELSLQPIDACVTPGGLGSTHGAVPLSEPTWLETARKELGVSEDNDPARVLEYHAADFLYAPTSTEDAWCASFVNWVLAKNGIKGTGLPGALKFRNWEGGMTLDRPAVGSIAVFDRGKGKGHVAFVIGKKANGELLYLGGNQSDMVNIAPNPRKPVAFIYPKDLIPNYDIPVVDPANIGSMGTTR
jgi:uncharacterized protein (TIGR02594 family)